MINSGLTCADVDDSSSVASILQKHQNTTIPPHIVCHYNTFIYPKYFNQYCNIFQICWFLTPAIRVFWADLWYFHTTYEFIPYANKPCCINTKHHHTTSFVIIRLLLFWNIFDSCLNFQKNIWNTNHTNSLLYVPSSFMKAICKSSEFGHDIWISFPILCILNSYKAVRISKFDSKYDYLKASLMQHSRKYEHEMERVKKCIYAVQGALGLGTYKTFLSLCQIFKVLPLVIRKWTIIWWHVDLFWGQIYLGRRSLASWFSRSNISFMLQ